MGVVQSVRLSVSASNQNWTDSGLIAQPGESIRIQANGKVLFGNGAGDCSFPEGSYRGATNACDDTKLENANAVITYTDLGAVAADFPVTNTRPVSLNVVFVDPGVVPSSAAGAFNNGTRVLRDSTINNPASTGAKRVWFIFNDQEGKFFNNSGSFDVAVERFTDTPDSPLQGVHQPSPIRIIPNPLLSVKRGVRQKTAYCWFIQPRYSAAEGYTNWDAPIECPAYQNEFGLVGNFTPAMTYQPFSGVDLTTIPIAIKLGVNAPDVKMIRIDSEKHERGFYEGAYVEVFEVGVEISRASRDLYIVGELGNAELELPESTIELTPMHEWANRPIGGRILPMCDVGRLPGETFGRMRCHNDTMHDGPNIANLTRGAVVAGVFSPSKFDLNPVQSGANPGFEAAFRGSHGRLIGKTGRNSNVVRDVGQFSGASGIIILRRAMPFTPAVGDLFELEAGCDKTPEMCRIWQNMKNFRGFEHVPGRAAVRRRYSRS